MTWHQKLRLMILVWKIRFAYVRIQLRRKFFFALLRIAFPLLAIAQAAWKWADDKACAFSAWRQRTYLPWVIRARIENLPFALRIWRIGIPGTIRLWKMELPFWPQMIKRAIWDSRLRLGWDRAWVRRNEFHPSLDINVLAMARMNEEKRKRYLDDVLRRRLIAHERDLGDPHLKALSLLPKGTTLP